MVAMKRSQRSTGRAALVVLVLVCALVLGLLAVLQLGSEDERTTALSETAVLTPHSADDVGDLEAGSVPRVASSAATASTGTDREALRTDPSEQLEVPIEHVVYGRLLDESGTIPVVDAVIRLSGGYPKNTGRSGEDGRFRIAWPSEEEPEVQIFAFGYVTRRIPSVALDTELEWRLVPGASIEVVGTGAMPLATEPLEAGANGALFAVELRLGARGRREPIISEFDVAGRAAIYDLPAGEYLLWARAPGTGVALDRVELDAGESLSMTLELPRAVVFEGRVLETDREVGIAGVEVRLRPSLQGVWREIEELNTHRATTDEAGRFAFESVHAGAIVVELNAPWGAREQRGLDLGGSSGRVTHEFRIDPPASLAGFVRDARGRPVADALVHVSVDKARGRPAEAVERGDEVGSGVRTQRTNEHGAFEFRELPAGPTLHLTASSRSDGSYSLGRFADSLADPITLKLDAGESRDDVVIQLVAAGELSGRVVDLDGEPIGGVDVMLARLGSGRWGLVESSKSGEFRLGGLIEGTYVLFLSHADHAVLRERIDWRAGSSEPGEYRLERLGRVEVAVVDALGGALSNVLVTGRAVGAWDGARPGDIRDRTDSYGRARLIRLQPGEWEFSAAASGFEAAGDPERVRVSTDAVESIELVLRTKPRTERATIVGTVSTPDGGVPRRLRFSDRRGGSLSVEDGRFRLTGAKPGRATLVLRAEDCVPHRTDAIQLIPGSEYDLGAIEFQPASRVHVDVRGPDGERLRGASARLLPLPTSEGGTGDKRRLAATTLNSGRLRFVDVPRKTWVLRVDLEGYRTHRERITAAELDERFTVSMRPD